MDAQVNEFGIPLRCVDCPVVAPTLDETRSLEMSKLVYNLVLDHRDALSIEQATEFTHRLDDIEQRIAGKMVKLGILVQRTDSCPGVKMTQVSDQDGERIHNIACGC